MVGRDFPSPDAARRTTRLLAGVIFGILFLAAQPALAVAAARVVPSCDRVARDLQSADVLVDSLKVEIVDHMTEDHGATDVTPGLSTGNATAPLLFLTPRVVHILEDIFGDAVTAEISPDEPAHKSLLTASASPQNKPDPGIEAPATGGNSSDEASPDIESAVLSGPMTETFYDADTLPHFQRQMFRTDI